MGLSWYVKSIKFYAPRSDFITHTLRTEIRKRHTIYTCVALIQSVFGAIHQWVQQSSRYITDTVSALTRAEDDSDVDQHTPGREASDFNPHLAVIHHGLHLWRQGLIDLLVTKETSQSLMIEELKYAEFC